MDTYEDFFNRCRQSLKKRDINFSKNQKTIIKTIYNASGNFTLLDFVKYVGSHFPSEKIIDTLNSFAEDHIIFKVENEEELTYSKDDQTAINSMNFEAKVIELINNNLDYENIYLQIKELYPDIEKLSVFKLIHAYNLLNDSNNISSELKTHLSSPQFIKDNPALILSLAKLYFHADTISIQNGEIVISKEIVLPEEKTLEIDEAKIISMVLKKLKYDRLNDKDLGKINELKEYKEHVKLYELLTKAIEYKYLIKHFNDSQLEMTKDELEKFMES